MDGSIRVTEIPASRGASWLAASWRLFVAAPMAWIGLCAGWIAVTFALLIIPYVGMVAAHFSSRRSSRASRSRPTGSRPAKKS